jgi:hypothetical protein
MAFSSSLFSNAPGFTRRTHPSARGCHYFDRLKKTHTQRSEKSSTDLNATRMMERMFRSHHLPGDGPAGDYLNKNLIPQSQK